MNMLKRINRVINEAYARYAEIDIEVRRHFIQQAATYCKKSTNEYMQSFGNGLEIGFEDGVQISKATPAFYRKYADCCFPTLWTTRDLISVLPETLHEGLDPVECMERALAK
jgi:hypothetical protein